MLRSGDTLSYEKLVVATGARMLPAFDHAITFGEQGSGEAMRELVDGVERGAVRRVAFIAPTSIGWTLPIYELALMTARAARRSQIDAELVLITREDRPLAVFGTQPSRTAAQWLRASGVEFIGAARADVRPGVVLLEPGQRSVPTDGVVALPLVRGTRLEGVPADEFGFIPVDRHGRVRGLEASMPQVTPPTSRSSRADSPPSRPTPSRPHIAAHVWAPRSRPPRSAPCSAACSSPAATQASCAPAISPTPTRAPRLSSPLWWPPTKIAGRYLRPTSSGGDASEAFGPPPSGFAEIDVELSISEQPDSEPQPTGR